MYMRLMGDVHELNERGTHSVFEAAADECWHHHSAKLGHTEVREGKSRQPVEHRLRMYARV